MSSNDRESQPLDQLQHEVNRVLEHIGRLFAAASDSSKSSPAAQAARLKQALPASINRFHEALDQLEDELQLAKTVMRRDLALSRERSGQQMQVHENVESAPEIPKITQAIESEVLPHPELEDVAPEEDTVMPDPASAATDLNDADSKLNDVDSKELDKPTDQQPQPSEAHPAENTSSETVTGDPELGHDSVLQINTKAEEPDEADEDKPPDTANTFNTNADLDSLFNDPLSAGAGGAPDFSPDQTAANEFDFDAFGANLDSSANDNDNISALLPGLQDYANTQPEGAIGSSSGQPDFDALFSTDAPAAEDAQHASAQHRDSTFDDLMDFADFNASDFVAEAGGGEDAENQDFEF